MRRFVITATKKKVEFVDTDATGRCSGEPMEGFIDRGTFANIEDLINYLDEKHPGLLPHRKGSHG